MTAARPHVCRTPSCHRRGRLLAPALRSGFFVCPSCYSGVEERFEAIDGGRPEFQMTVYFDPIRPDQPVEVAIAAKPNSDGTRQRPPESGTLFERTWQTRDRRRGA